MKLPFLSRNNPASGSLKSRWPWPSCHQPRTLSFRNVAADSINEDDEWPSFSGEAQYCVETVIRSVRSERRLLFKPAGETKSMVECPVSDESILPPPSSAPFKKSVTLTMESDDPFRDFKESMEEMVEAQGLKDWTDLEQLLSWYLKVNGKSNHGYIVGAFVDLLIGLASAAAEAVAADQLTEASSSSSSSTSSCSCCFCDSTSHFPAPVAPSVSPSSPLSFYTFSNSSEECDASCSVSVSHRRVFAPAKVVEQIGADEEDDATSASSSSSPL